MTGPIGTIRCPVCAGPMLRNVNARTAAEALHCRYCPETMAVPESVRLLESGEPQLPGFASTTEGQ